MECPWLSKDLNELPLFLLRVIFSCIVSSRSFAVGSQSIGAVRALKALLGRNFHLRKRVQMSATPPTLAPMAAMTVTALRIPCVVEAAA